jgi:hypothetical protein
MYSFRLELQAGGWPDIPRAAALASALGHFAICIASARHSARDPAHDYLTEIEAHPPDGRSIVLLESAELRSSVEQVADTIRAAKLP